MQSKPSTRLIGAALAAATLVTLPACGGRTEGKDLAYVARDVETLYAEAQRRLDRGATLQAAALFDEVERQHPYSPWARRAQLMSAFSYYVARDYNKAIQNAQRFLSIHPGNKDAPYAYYLIALSYYEQISDVNRDQKITEQAQTALREVNRRFPQTECRVPAEARSRRRSPRGKEWRSAAIPAQGPVLAADMRSATWWRSSTHQHTPEALTA